MPRCLFLGLPLHGHTNPTLALVAELVERGHEVIYYSTEPFKRALTRVGATYRPYLNDHLNHAADIPQHLHKLVYLLTRTASEVLDGQLEEMRALRPDYVLADASAPWGGWVASVLGVPAFTSVSTMAFNKAVMRYGFKHGVRPESAGKAAEKLRHIWKGWRIHRALRRRYPRRPPGFLQAIMGRSNLHVVYTSRMFQPCVETFDAKYVFIGPSVTREELQPFAWPEDHRPIVYVSFGTLFHQAETFYKTCFEALASAPVRVILSVGHEATVTALAPCPRNFSLYSRVPQLHVLERCAAFISHGGMNSVSESLSFGVPLVVIPQMSEQLFVGRRAEQLGAAIVIEKEQVTAAVLRAAVDRLLSDSTFRENAAKVGQSFRAAGGPSVAVDAIEAFLGRAHAEADDRVVRRPSSFG